jgi:hypothetical protein
VTKYVRVNDNSGTLVLVSFLVRVRLNEKVWRTPSRKVMKLSDTMKKSRGFQFGGMNL